MVKKIKNLFEDQITKIIQFGINTCEFPNNKSPLSRSKY